MRYFEQFPVVIYKSKFVRNITKRVKVLERAKTLQTIYYPYTIRDGEKVDQVAYNYYGDPYYWWIIMIVNDLVDPYLDWPLAQQDFDRYIKAKYGSMQAAQAEIVHYEKEPPQYYIHNLNPHSPPLTQTEYLSLNTGQRAVYEPASLEPQTGIIISPEAYDDLTEDADEWSPVYAYNLEYERNEAKRTIKLLDLAYLTQIENELQSKMKES